jgi:excisionase family DNA binding protein
MQSQFSLSIADTAKALNISRPSVYKEIQNGRLRTFTIGRRRLVSPDSLRDYIAQREKAGGGT